MSSKVKKTPLAMARATHKLVVRSSILINAIDEVGGEGEFHEGFKEAANNLLKYCEEIVENAYGVEGVMKSTYLTELETKIDTVIRKEYKPIS